MNLLTIPTLYAGLPRFALYLIIGGSVFSLFFFIFSFALGFGYFNRVFRRKGSFDDALNMHSKADTPEKKWLLDLEKEEITMKSFDNLNLKGYFVDNKGSTKIALIVHGYHGTWLSLAAQAKMFYEDGYSLLLINHRCHGSSEGKHFSMGAKETKDLLMWIDLLNNRNREYRIVLFGVSMGAHIIMMTADKLPFNVMCAIEDCGFTSLYRQMLYTSHITNAPFFRYSTFMASIITIIFYQFSCHNNAKRSLPRAKIPFLFMHGDLDGIVPYKNLERASSYFSSHIYKEVVTFKECDHCEQIHRQPDLYKEKLIGFVNKFVK